MTVRQYVYLRILEWGIILAVLIELARLARYRDLKYVQDAVSKMRTQTTE